MDSHPVCKMLFSELPGNKFVLEMSIFLACGCGEFPANARRVVLEVQRSGRTTAFIHENNIPIRYQVSTKVYLMIKRFSVLPLLWFGKDHRSREPRRPLIWARAAGCSFLIGVFGSPNLR
jgi:hypothetical protein